jgi:lysophospholipase L1-like esterase
MKRAITGLSLLLPMLATASASAAETAYLRPGEVIVCIGDSVTAAGVYDGFLQTMLDRLYPEAGIRVLNRGLGGQTASAASGLLQGTLKTERPTLATFMFGVNDTRWSAGDEEAKAAAFVAGLTAALDLAEKHQVVPLLLRESHFSHGQAPDAFATRVNVVLDHLMAAQAALAAERGVPVIDTQGAYKRALATAWAADPKYEFSPDIVHPNAAGHAALAGELLRALGAGLPLAAPAGERGPLQLAAANELAITFTPAAGVLAPTATLTVPVTFHNRSAVAEQGTLLLVLPDLVIETRASVAAGATTTVTCDIPLAKLGAERGVVPLYAAFRGEQRFTAASTLFWHSRLRPTAAAPVRFSATDFLSASATDARVCPVSQVTLRRHGPELIVDFTWADQTLVLAKAGFKNRFGTAINTLLDLNNREGQPCDAVEFFLDQRPVDAIGRPTANADANPEGVLRLGVCFTEVDGQPVARVLSLPDLPAEALSLTPAGAAAWTLKVKVAPACASLGFAMRVTDNTEFKVAGTPPFWLTGQRGTGQEPMGFVQLGEQAEGVLYRIGY